MDQKNVTHPWPQRLLWLLSFQDQVSGLKTKSEASGQSLKWLKPRDSRVKSQDLRPKTKSHHQGIATQTPALRCALFSTPPWSWSWLQNTAIITITKCPLPPLKKEEWPTFSFVLLEDTYLNIVRTEEKNNWWGKIYWKWSVFWGKNGFSRKHTYICNMELGISAAQPKVPKLRCSHNPYYVPSWNNNMNPQLDECYLIWVPSFPTIYSYLTEQDHLRMNIAPDQTIHRSF